MRGATGVEPAAEAGRARELLRLAWPLVLSNGLWTMQITLDRVLLSRSSGEAVGAAMAAVMLFWTPLGLLQATAAYSMTFVAQYSGAGQPHRVGPAVWQALYFAAGAGLLFAALAPFAGLLVAVGGHTPALQELEAAYFRCLCFSALPTLVTAAASGFFSGRGDSRTVLALNAAGLTINAVLAYAWIFGHGGFPAWGIVGAGWATVVGSSTSALLAVGLMLRRRHRAAYHTAAGWRFDADLFRRLLRYGLPAGVANALDTLAFTVFLFLIGRLGEVELAATSVAFTLNLVAALPALGVGQAVAILVGQRLGEDRPDLAARSSWTGLGLAVAYMTAVALVYVLLPGPLVALFRSDEDPVLWGRLAALVPVLLRFVAVYSLFDSMNLVLSSALRGAGDTRFVTAAAIVLAWPIMVLPTWVAWSLGWGLYWAWTFASLYIVVVALVFLVRFVQGRWRSMRVIETVPVHDGVSRKRPPAEAPLAARPGA